MLYMFNKIFIGSTSRKNLDKNLKDLNKWADFMIMDWNLMISIILKLIY